MSVEQRSSFPLLSDKIKYEEHRSKMLIATGVVTSALLIDLVIGGPQLAALIISAEALRQGYLTIKHEKKNF